MDSTTERHLQAVTSLNSSYALQDSATLNDNDIHSRFGLNMGIGELLQNWGFLNLSPFRRKSSKPGTSSPSNQSPQRHMQASIKTSPDAEHIELVQLSDIKVSDALWKNIHGKTAVAGDVFFTNMPIMVTAKPVSLKHEGKQQVCNVDLIQMNEPPETRETKLRNSTALVLIDEEVEEMQRGIGHNFLQSDCNYPTWCDRCGDLLWGLYETGYLRCRSTLILNMEAGGSS